MNGSIYTHTSSEIDVFGHFYLYIVTLKMLSLFQKNIFTKTYRLCNISHKLYHVNWCSRFGDTTVWNILPLCQSRECTEIVVCVSIYALISKMFHICLLNKCANNFAAESCWLEKNITDSPHTFSISKRDTQFFAPLKFSTPKWGKVSSWGPNFGGGARPTPTFL